MAKGKAMTTKKKTVDKKTSLEETGQVSFFVEPGKKIKLTLDVGEVNVEGKVSLTVYIEEVKGESVPEPASLTSNSVYEPAVVKPEFRWATFDAIKNRVRTYDLAAWLFLAAIAVYLLTRLIGLTQFPIYFFTDEAIQSLSMVDLIENGYRDPNGVLLPTFFRNGDYYNIGLSVYLQWLPVILFGKSAVATRAMSVLVTLIAAVSVGIILRDIFKLKYWWVGVLFLSIAPAWFLHSRTAFETAEFVAFYAGTLCAYLFYRHKSPHYLYVAVLLGALSFYSYSPAQVIVPLTALGLLLSDWRYHWENRRTVFMGLGVAAILALPYVRFSINNPSTPFAHLHTLWSYWFEDIPLSEKISRYFSEFGIGLSAWYWYIPNDRDLPRHLMKDYGHIMIMTLPLALLGVVHALRNLRLAEYRAILVTLLICPAASALVQVSITRTLMFVIPAAILTAIGLENILQWLEDPKRQLEELAKGPGSTPLRVGSAVLIFLAGFAVAAISDEGINQIAVAVIATLLALQVSGLVERLAQSILRADESAKPKLWRVPPAVIALSVFLALSAVNIRMLNEVLRNGPLWFRDYGLGGMQYGGFQIFDIIERYVKEHPETRVIFSPDWANGADVVARFFLEDFSSIQIGSVRGHITEKLPLDDHTLFIMTPQEYDMVLQSEKLTDVNVETVVPYPDGNPGFYFVRLRYVENIDQIFAEEKAARQALREMTVTLDGEDVKLRHSYLDSEFQDQSMALVFDNDNFTLAKTLESNPFIMEMTFPKPRTLNGFSIIIGTANVQITLKCYSEDEAEPSVYTFEGQGTKDQPELSFDLPAPVQIEALRWEVLDPFSPEQARVHIWELKLR